MPAPAFAPWHESRAVPASPPRQTAAIRGIQPGNPALDTLRAWREVRSAEASVAIHRAPIGEGASLPDPSVQSVPFQAEPLTCRAYGFPIEQTSQRVLRKE